MIHKPQQIYAPAYQIQYGVQNNNLQQQKARKMIENYSYGLSDQIGKGFSSKVFKGRDETTHEPVAVKVIDLQMLKTQLHHQLLQSEIDSLSQINHPNVMKLYKVFQTQNNTYLITEFCEAGDLASRIEKQGKQQESSVQALLYGIIQGYRELRKRNIVHRDIKPANILISNSGVPKIADFGFATTPNSPPMLPNVNVGSPLYMSPQALQSNRYSDKSDIWAIGVSAYELLFGQVPWNAASETELLQKMISIPLQFVGTNVSMECQDFLRRCLIVDDKQRINIDEMENHSWIQKIAVQARIQQQIKLHQTPGTHLQNKMFVKHQQIMNGQNLNIINNGFQAKINHEHTSMYNDPLKESQNRDKNPNQIINVNVKNKQEIYGKENNNRSKVLFEDVNTSINMNNNKIRFQVLDELNRQKSQSKHNKLNNVNNSNNNSNSNNNTMQKKQNIYYNQNYVREEETIKIFRTDRQSPVAQSKYNISSFETNIIPEESKRNDIIILSQINFCRYLNRVAQLLDKVKFYKQNSMEEKIQFFVNKNIMIKMHKLKELINQNPNNSLNLFKFQEYKTAPSFNKITQVIQQYHQKFAVQFSQLWLSLQSHRITLQSDKKFDAIFDENITEFESFYIILQSVQRQVIRDLTQHLDETLQIRDRDPEQQISLEEEDSVVLLDYLVTYFQLTALILDQFNQYEIFAQQSKIEQIAEGKPVRLTYGHFIEIRNKIQQLEI